MILYSLCRKKGCDRCIGFKLYTVLLENGDLFRIFRTEERERDRERGGRGEEGISLTPSTYLFRTVFETGHRNMKNKIFIAFELLKFDENDIKQWPRLKLLIHTVQAALVYIYIYI